MCTKLIFKQVCKVFVGCFSIYFFSNKFTLCVASTVSGSININFYVFTFFVGGGGMGKDPQKVIKSHGVLITLYRTMPIFS